MIRKILKGVAYIFAALLVLAILSGGDKKSEGGATNSTKKETDIKTGAEINQEKVGQNSVQQPSPIGSSDARTPKINVPGWSDSPYITGDGKELYYMYSRYNFFPIFTGGKPVLEGVAPIGHHSNDTNPFDDSDIYVSKRNADGTWSEPTNLSFNDTRGGCCLMVVKGPPFTAYYQIHYPENGTDLVYRVRDGNGNYGKEINFGKNVNSPSNEDNPHVSYDQKKLWFTSYRPGGKGGADIWYSEKINGEWSPAVNVGALNTDKNEDQVWVNKDETVMYFNRDSSVYSVEMKGGVFGEQKIVDLGRPFVAEVSLTDDGKEIFFGSSDPASKRIIIYRALLQPNGSWGSPIPVD